ncbi:DUF2269 family protein [Amycolatopsis taiwanensis]|uniref:DUF2269 domain-containing protein n=1 Tax=Amycolatopsis taiwanensis TaxID=342230 RepID=A0A9W6R2G0_9PSEU|nr:DUF2269 family protein [Amycolatopsis taiwanensis]GLY68291.1 hypothetical protein Atai01_49100 [Amycolatopsis taiwanensis]
MSRANRWRQSAVWLHILTSVGWMTLAVTLVTLMVTAGASDDLAVRVSAMSMAHQLDLHLLAPSANASALTGFLLAAATPWGFFRSWWVLAKFVITIVQLNLGIFLLSPALQAAEDAARAGEENPATGLQIAGTAFMAGAIAFQAWLSVTKPWRRTPFSATGKPPSAPAWVFAGSVWAPLTDLAAGTVLGFPLPLLSTVVLAIRLVTRRRQATPTPPTRRTPVAAS